MTSISLSFGKDKHALKVANIKLRTHKRAKKKREDTANVLRKIDSSNLSEVNDVHTSTHQSAFLENIFSSVHVALEDVKKIRNEQ
ncbi:hypothetical protein ACP70R_024204 [Stipagrostis hirtigluma subsp. patula]